MADSVTLKSGKLEVELAPALGGSVLRFEYGDQPLFRPPPLPADLTSARVTGCFPLMPFSNRLKDGRFRYDGAEYQLPLNFGDHPHTIHGDGWQRAWTVGMASPHAAILTYDHDGEGGWPFRYRALQYFTLTGESLTIRLTLVNCDLRRFPAGIGLHPYFPKEDAILTTRAPRFWKADGTQIPLHEMPTPPAWDFSAGKRVDGLEIDHCFTGWGGQAGIHWPSRGLTLDMRAEPPLAAAVIYVPAGKPFFCVEPVSNINNGINLRDQGVGGTGVVDLDPGDCLSATVQFAVRRDS